MCATCGCGEGESVVSRPDLPGPSSNRHEDGHPHPASEHEDAHDHAYDHDHGDHHGHQHDHAHHHGHDRDHAHDHDHGHDQGHDHHHGSDHEHPRPASKAVANGPNDRSLSIERDVLARNNLLAERNRGWLEGRRIFALNVMSSPGAGKTTLLEQTIVRIRGTGISISVVEGDQATRRDAERIQAAGAKAVQINTGTGCHLDARMIADGLRELDPAPRSLLVIENVGNLVCPALFDLGENAKVVLISVTEGEDKPLKYPHMFRAADVLVLNKVDLLPHVPFDPARFLEHVRAVNPRVRIFQVSALRGDGLDGWTSWLTDRARAYA